MALDTSMQGMATPAAAKKGHAHERGSTSTLTLWERMQYKAPSDTDRMFFTEQLSLLLETGTSLHPALRSIRSQVANPAMLKIVDGLAESVSDGRTFAQSLSHYPELFSTTYINLVGAAEAGGFLDTVLLELMRMDEKRDELKRSVSAALAYPGFLVFFSFAVIIFVLVAVFPKFADLFVSIADQLPATTIVLMGASKILINHWPWVVAGHVLVLGGCGYWLKHPHGQKTLATMKLKTPLIKEIFIQVYLIHCLRVLGLSLKNGVSLPDALVNCRDVIDNHVFREFLVKVERNVSEGAGFASGFNDAYFIPATVKQMVTTGEETGNLPTVLSRIAEYYERELEKKLASFSRMVEPLMLIVMGGVVGVIVSSLILPIFKLSSAVG